MVVVMSIIQTLTLKELLHKSSKSHNPVRLLRCPYMSNISVKTCRGQQKWTIYNFHMVYLYLKKQMILPKCHCCTLPWLQV